MKKPIVLMTLLFGGLACISKAEAIVTNATMFKGLNTVQRSIFDPREEEEQQDRGQEPSDQIQLKQ